MKEASKAMRRRANFTQYDEFFRGHGIDIGCGDDNIIQFADRFGILSCRGYDQKDGNDGETCLNIEDQSFDFLHSSHSLEHMPDPIKAVKNWIRVVRTGGYLVITVPDEVMYEKNRWPSIMTREHNWSFRMKPESDLPRSLHVPSFFSQFQDVELVSIKYLDEGYYETDQDLTRVTDKDIECSIEIVLRKVSHSYKPMTDWALNGFGFVINSLAMGDVIATAPAIKYAIDKYYADGQMPYKVVGKKMFRPIFPFVDDAHWRDFEDKENDWDIPRTWAVGALNQNKTGTNIIRNTPRAMLLGQYAGLKMFNTLMPTSVLNYIPLEKVDVLKFGTDFSKAVVFVSTYRDEIRGWKAEYLLEVARWVKSMGLLPVFIGRTDMNLDTRLIPKTSLPADVSEYGLDLRNQTTISELYTIMAQSRAVLGIDSGPIHLAGCSDVPIVCGYTCVDAEYRVPIREKGITIPIAPKLQCASCESNWAGHFHNYEECFFGHGRCSDDMTADRFIDALKIIL